ncbi:MAG: TM2 domain-containing protein [Candidatus Nanopelagicaceae bacterium]
MSQFGNPGMNTAAQWIVSIPGQGDRQLDYNAICQWVKAKQIKADTLVREVSTGAMYPAKQIPGVFSDKEYLVALLLSLFLGVWGVDRFYLGHIGIGIGKLLTFGGCGIWAIIDVILIAVRNVTDTSGRPLA